jgi:hypothetical protein
MMGLRRTWNHRVITDRVDGATLLCLREMTSRKGEAYGRVEISGTPGFEVDGIELVSETMR